MQKDNIAKGLAEFAMLLGLFNVFLMISKYFAWGGDHLWNLLYAQYFMSYSDEFVKRGLVGTLFRITGQEPDTQSILMLSYIASNLFFALFFMFSRKQMSARAEQTFLPFILLFIISPAIAMHLSLDAGRFDHFNLVLTVTALIALVQGGRLAYIFVPLVMVAGMLVHEAFLFINAPLLFAVTYNEIRKGRYTAGLLYAEVAAIAVPFLCILIWGGALPETLQRVNGHIAASMPGLDIEDSLTVWTKSLRDNVALALGWFGKPNLLKHMLLAIPFFIASVLLYHRMLGPTRLSRSQKLVYASPFVLLLMFALGADFFRWMALCIIMMFITFAYLAHEVDISSLKVLSLRDRLLLIFIGLYTLCGPLGINLPSFPLLRIS